MTDFDPQAGRAMPADPPLTGSQAEADDSDLSAAVQDLAELVADVDELEAVLAHVAAFAVTAIPGADGAGVTLLRDPDRLTSALVWAVTDPFVREIDHLQYDICREGPCLTAIQTRRPQVSGSLGSDDRWPRFGGRVARLQVHSALSLPLVSRDRPVGALNVYARTRDAFTEHALRLAVQFATPAAVSVGNLQLLQLAHERATQLQSALVSRAVIDQAIGIVRSRTGGSAPEAFDRLRTISQTENVKLSLVAERIVEEAVRRVHARHRHTDEPA